MEILAARWPMLLLIGLVLVGSALRVGVANPNRAINQNDESTYWYSAQSLLKHGTLTRELTGEMARGETQALPTPALSPGYPVFIAAVGLLAPDSTASVLWANVLLSIATLGLIALIAQRLRLRPWAAALVVGFAALYPGFMYSIDRMLTEQLYLSLFVGFAFAMVCAMETGKLWQTAVAGALLALATHVRAQAVPFLLVAAVFLLISRPRHELKQHLLVLAAAFAIAMSPWWIRNVATFGRFIFLSEAGEGAAVWGATPYFLDMSASTGTLAEVVGRNMPANEAVYYRWRVFGYLQYMWGDVWDEWLTHPQRPLRWVLVTHYLVVVVGVVLAPVVALIRRSPAALFIACVPLVVTICNAPFHGLPRYAFPAVPFAIITFGLLLSPGGSVPSALGRWQVLMALAVRYVFAAIAAIMSLALLYSLFLFPARIDDEVSRYRLSRYMHTSPEKLGAPFWTDHYEVAQSSISATKPLRDGWVKNNDVNQYPIVRIDVAPSGKARVVTKVTMKAKGGFLFDYTTLYWRGPKTPVNSENSAYRVPSGRFIDEVTFYIDDDVTHLMLVPRVFRWGKFRVDGVDVEKYQSP